MCGVPTQKWQVGSRQNSVRAFVSPNSSKVPVDPPISGRGVWRVPWAPSAWWAGGPMQGQQHLGEPGAGGRPTTNSLAGPGPLHPRRPAGMAMEPLSDRELEGKDPPSNHSTHPNPSSCKQMQTRSWAAERHRTREGSPAWGAGLEKREGAAGGGGRGSP